MGNIKEKIPKNITDTKDIVQIEFASEEQARAFYKWASSMKGIKVISDNLLDEDEELWGDIPLNLGACNELDKFFYIEVE